MPKKFTIKIKWLTNLLALPVDSCSRLCRSADFSRFARLLFGAKGAHEAFGVEISKIYSRSPRGLAVRLRGVGAGFAALLKCRKGGREFRKLAIGLRVDCWINGQTRYESVEEFGYRDGAPEPVTG
jgi:hypothetical protein